LVVSDDHESILHRYGNTGFKNFGVMSLTVWGHVTSLVTWLLDSAYVVSYWRSIVTMHLTCIVTKIWGLNILGSRPWLLGSRDVIDHLTIGLGVSTFLLVVNDDHAPILHGYGDTGLQRFWGHEFDFLGSCDVIGHVSTGLDICGFLLVVRCNHASILHRYEDIGPQRYWGHDFDLLGSRDVIDNVTIGLVDSTFLLVVSDDHESILHRYRNTGFKNFGVMSLTVWGHVTSSIT